MTTSLGIATEGLLQDEGQGGCKSTITVKTDQARVVSVSNPQQTVTAKGGGTVTVNRSTPQRISPVQSPQVVRVQEPVQIVQVGANVCLGGGTSGGGGSGGTSELFTPSRENGYLYPINIGQVVCVVNGQWQPATSALNRYQAIGFVIEPQILAGAFGRAQTTGMMTLTVNEWDQVTDYVGGLVPEAPYYLGPSGKMSPNPPASGALVRLGYALSSTQFSIDIESPILL